MKKKIFSIIFAVFILFSVFDVFSYNVFAANKITRKYDGYVGYEAYIYNGTSIKINNKKPSKLKNKVYMVKSFSSDNNQTYMLSFLKKGKYTVTYKKKMYRYTYSSKYNATNDGTYNYYYTIYRYDNVTGKKVALKGKFKETIYDRYRLYDNNSGVIFAVGMNDDGEYGIWPAKYTSNRKISISATKQTYSISETYNINKKYSNPIKKITLGNAYYETKEIKGIGRFEGLYKKNQFLKGKTGKLSVKTSDDYKIMDIVVVTSDKNGNQVYKLLKNNKSVTYGQYSNSDELFKTTNIYVFYKNKLDGTYTDILDIKKDSSGQYIFDYKTQNGEESSTYFNLPNNCHYVFYK